MGLRIIDRIRPEGLSLQCPEQESTNRAGLEQEVARNFANLSGQDNSEKEFLKKLRASQARLLNPTAMLDHAVEVRTCLRLMQTAAQPVHGKIDIATLIDLL